MNLLIRRDFVITTDDRLFKTPNVNAAISTLNIRSLKDVV